MELDRVILLIIIGCCICYFVVRGKWEKRSRQEKFKGQVAGLCAGFALSNICSDYTAEQIYRYAIKEFERCRSIDKNRPDPSSDQIYYASFDDFAEFTMLCALRYFETEGSNFQDASAIREYCQSKLIHSRKLTAGIPSLRK